MDSGEISHAENIDRLRLQVERLNDRLDKIEENTIEIRSALLGNKEWDQVGFISETKKKFKIKNLISRFYMSLLLRQRIGSYF